MKASQWLLLVCFIQICPLAVTQAQTSNPSAEKRLYVGFDISVFPQGEYSGNDSHFGAAVKYDFPVGEWLNGKPLSIRAAVSGGWKYLSLGTSARISFVNASFIAFGISHDEFFRSDNADVSYRRDNVLQNLSYSISFGIETRNMWFEMQWRRQFDETRKVNYFYSKDGSVFEAETGQAEATLSLNYGIRFGL
jgi:hypothetical protein